MLYVNNFFILQLYSTVYLCHFYTWSVFNCKIFVILASSTKYTVYLSFLLYYEVHYNQSPTLIPIRYVVVAFMYFVVPSRFPLRLASLICIFGWVSIVKYCSVPAISCKMNAGHVQNWRWSWLMQNRKTVVRKETTRPRLKPMWVIFLF